MKDVGDDCSLLMISKEYNIVYILRDIVCQTAEFWIIIQIAYQLPYKKFERITKQITFFNFISTFLKQSDLSLFWSLFYRLIIEERCKQLYIKK